MLIDINESNNNDISNGEYDFCIVGAGAAGITLALQLEKKGFKIALCEAGSDQYSLESQESYQGRVFGDPYLSLEGSRLRYLGGSTNHWAGWCRPFEEMNFKRDYLGPEYLWPIVNDDFVPYLSKACEILEIKNDFEYSSQIGNDIKKIKLEFSPPVRFKDKYKKDLMLSERISLLLNANLIDLAGDHKKIYSATFQSYNNHYVRVNAKKFVFAMGGIENSRFLLWFSEKYGNYFYDNRTPIGEYWMEHPHFTLGKAFINYEIASPRFYSISGKLQRELGILGCGLRLDLQPEGGSEEMLKELSCIAPRLARKVSFRIENNLMCGIRFRASWEQAPVKSNSVHLSDSKDRFGIPKVDMYWTKQPIDRKTIRETIRVFNDWILNQNLGRIQLQNWILNDLNYPVDDELAGNHHMGGTRMSALTEFGVVDGNCRVYGSNNLFIAGSSTFTTSGFNNPTLPIIQLVLRLSDHLTG